MKTIGKTTAGIFILAAAMVLAPSGGWAAPQAIPIYPLESAPIVDGVGSEWGDIPSVLIPVKGDSGKFSVTVRAGVFGNRVYMNFSWPDSTKDVHHKPHVWNKDSGFYETGKQREDRFAISFMMSGDYDINPTSGKEFKADMWHWKAARTNPAGLAHDKYWVISRKLPAKEEYGKSIQPVRTGGKIGMYRLSDKGGKIYKSSKRPEKYMGDLVPKYRAAKKVTGSVADVKAKGVWKNGRWTLEFSRLLDTGHPGEDATFRKGRPVRGAIAVFDHRGDNHHSNSEELVFEF